jgi:hypothetical protein
MSTDPVGSADPNVLEEIRKKFDAYFNFTTGRLPRILSFDRRTQQYTYTEESIVLDIIFLTSLFAQLYEAYKKNKEKLHLRHPAAWLQIMSLFDERGPETGAFYQQGKASPVARNDFNHPEICRTLRNAFQHFNYKYTDLTAQEYIGTLSLPGDVRTIIREFDFYSKPAVPLPTCACVCSGLTRSFCDSTTLRAIS